MPSDGQAQNDFAAIRWLPVRSQADPSVEGDALPYSVLMVTGTDPADGSILVNRPNADSIDPALLLLNGPGLLAAGQDGQANAASPALALYDTADGTPSVADTSWGSGANTWKLRKGKTGFKIHGNPDGGVVLVARQGAGCLAPGGVGGTVTDHFTFVGTDCATGQDVQYDVYLPCPGRLVVTVLGPADCCTTAMTYTVASTTRATVNGGASAVGTDGSTISFDVVPTTDGTLAANSDALLPSQKAVKTYVDNVVTGLLDLKGTTDCSANPNYPAALKGDAYYVTVAGKVGGASGKPVDVGDVYFALADNAGGTEAAVGASWAVLEHNLVGALLAANNLSDVASAATARANLGLQIGVNVQAWDADLDALAALSGTNAIYYRSAANTWTAVTVGSGLSFSGGTLANAGVLGPASTTDLAFALFDGTTGKLIRDGGTRLPTYDPATGSVRVKQAAGSWSFSFGVKGSSGTDRGGFGFTGSSDVHSSYWIGLDQTHRGLTVTKDGEVVVNWDQAADPTKVIHRLFASAGQSEDIDRVHLDGTTVAERVNKDGRRVTKKTSAPADADLANGEMTWWCDDANGWPALKMKKSDGTVLDFGDCTQFLYDNTVTWNSATCALTFTKTVKYLRGPILVNTTAC